jgi:Zn-dependent protease
MIKIKKEIKHIIIAVLILTFIFGFDDKQPSFVFSYWIKNLIIVALITSITILIHNLAHKFTAKKFGGKTEFRIWSIQRYGFAPDAKLPVYLKFLRLKIIPIKVLPLGPIIGVLIALFSKGKLYLPLVESFELKQERHKRIGRKFPNITEYENSLIALSGPVTNTLFALILQTINSNNIFDFFIIINLLYALFHLIPLSNLDGAKIALGTPYLYIFISLSIIITSLIIKTLTIFQSILIAAIFALILTWIVLYLEKTKN